MIDRWYYISDRQKVGPFTFKKLQQLFLSRKLQTDRVFQQGSGKWTEVSELTFGSTTLEPSPPAANDRILDKIVNGTFHWRDEPHKPMLEATVPAIEDHAANNTSAAAPQSVLAEALRVKLTDAPAPLKLAQLAQGLPRAKNVKTARFLDEVRAILSEKVILGQVFCHPSGKHSENRYWSRDEKRILREETIAVAGKPNSITELKKDLPKEVNGADRAFFETVVRELISEGRLYEYPSKNKTRGPLFGAAPPPPPIPWLQQVANKDTFNSVVANCQDLLKKTGVTVDLLIDTLRSSLGALDTRPERTSDSSPPTSLVPEKKEPAKTPPSNTVSPPVATYAPAPKATAPSPPPVSSSFPATTGTILSGTAEASERTGFDPDTGQVINAARYEQWKKDQTHKSSTTNEPGVSQQVVALEQGRRAVEKWVDGDANRELVTKGDIDAILKNTSLQECLNPYGRFGKEMLDKLERHLRFMVENRKKFYAASQISDSKRKSARIDQPSKDEDMDGFPNLEL